MKTLTEHKKTLLLLAEGETELSTEEYEAIHGVIDYLNKLQTESVVYISKKIIAHIAKAKGYTLNPEQFETLCDMTKKGYDVHISLLDLVETNILCVLSEN